MFFLVSDWHFVENKVEINVEAAVMVMKLARNLTIDNNAWFFCFFCVDVMWFSYCISWLVKVVAIGRMIVSKFFYMISPAAFTSFIA